MESGRAQLIADGATQFAAERGRVRAWGHAIAAPTRPQWPERAEEGEAKFPEGRKELPHPQSLPKPEESRHRRVSVLECASPLALSHTHAIQSGRGLPHSKTLRTKLRFRR